MTITERLPYGRSQFLMTSGKRNIAMRRLILTHYVKPSAILKYLPRPEFAIGSQVSDHWTDEFGEDFVESGEVVGICWHPRKATWAYLIDWYKGGSPDFCYPCFDGSLVIGGDLREVK